MQILVLLLVTIAFILILIKFKLLIKDKLIKIEEFEKNSLELTSRINEYESLINTLNQKIEYINNDKIILYKEKLELDKKIELQEDFISKNMSIGEYYSFLDLKEISKLYSDFIVFNNILFCMDYTKQIDHLILTKQGLIIIDTKYWAGTIFNNVYRSSVPECLKFLIPDDKKRHTLRVKIKKDTKKYDLDCFEVDQTPISQVKQSAVMLNEYLSKNDIHLTYIKGLVYYNFNHSNKDNCVYYKDGELDSLDDDVTGFTNVTQLSKYIDKFMDKPQVISDEEFQKIKKFFENNKILN